MRNIRKNRNIHLCLVILLGVVSGYVFKYFDDTMTYPDFNLLSDKLIYTFELDRVFSELTVFLVIGTMLAIYASTPKRAGMNNLLYFLSLNLGYYGYMQWHWGFVLWGFVASWVFMSLLTYPLGYMVWFGRGDYSISKVVKFVLLTLFCVFGFAYGDFALTGKGLFMSCVFLGYLGLLKPNWKVLVLSLLVASIFCFLIGWNQQVNLNPYNL